MSDIPDANLEQVKYWSEEAGPRWVAVQERADIQLRPLGLKAMDVAGIAPGERVLDVGAGCGDTTLELARRVGPAGHVHAVDVSATMLDVARARVADAGFGNVSLQLGDAQVSPIERGPHDVVFSRFGVMFFDDPPLAFRKLLGATREGGRLAFCCWRAKEENAWLAGSMRLAARFVEMPPPPEPHAPGPFGLFDRDRTLAILSAAGWRDVAIEPFDQPMLIGGGVRGGVGGVESAIDFLVRLGPLGVAMAEAPAATRAELLAALHGFFAPHLRPEGVVMNGAVWIVTARR